MMMLRRGCGNEWGIYTYYSSLSFFKYLYVYDSREDKMLELKNCMTRIVALKIY